MTPSVVLFVLLFVFLFLIAFGVPIAISMGVASLVVLLLGHLNPILIVQRMFASVDSFALIAVPFFILSGDLMSEGKTSQYIMDFMESITGFIRGSLWIVAIFTSMIFAAISGSSAAVTAAIGGALMPQLKKRGYESGTSAAVIASGGTIGVVIPPSVPMVLYASITFASVSKLFLNGFFPGILMGIALSLVAINKAYKESYPRVEKISIRNIFRTFIIALPGILTPVIILGGIFSGIFTPSEAAVVGVVWAIICSLFIYRDSNIKSMLKVFVKSSITSAVVMFLIAVCGIFSWILAYWSIPQMISHSLLSITSNPYIGILLVDVVLLIAGVFMETASIILIFTPVLFQYVTALGINPVHFGVIETVAVAIGMITPPVAINLYVISGISGISIEEVSKKVLPFLITLIIVLLLYTYLPMVFPKLIL
jgi:C4-dicarboxylate transporter DctM subunit